MVKYVIDSQTGERRAVEPEPIRQIPLQAAHLKAVLDGMVDVNKTGTGKSVFKDAPYSVGGKTGTAQVYSLRGQRYDKDKVRERLRDHSWFIAYAPAENPQIALAVLVENGGFGAKSAAPIARQVLDYYLVDRHAAAPEAEDVQAVEGADEQAVAGVPAPPPPAPPNNREGGGRRTPTA